MTVPGSCSRSSTRARSTGWRRGCPPGCAVVSATNGKTTTAAMAAEILRPRFRLAHNRSGANLVSGRRLHPARRRRRRARPARGGRGGAARGAPPGPAAAPSASATSSATSSTATASSSCRRALARGGRRPAEATRARRERRRPAARRLAAARPRVVFGLDDPRVARPALQHAADSKYCIRCGTPYDYAAAYVGHLGDYRCPNCGHARPPLEVAARDDRAATGSSAPPSTSSRPRERGASSSRCPASTTSTTRSARRRSRVRSARRSTRSPPGSAASAPRSAGSSGSRSADKRLLLLLIKNPAGANEAVRTLVDGGAPRVAVVALNDAIADGRDVSWIWDVDFEPLLAGLETRRRDGRARRRARAPLPYGGLDESAHRGRARSRARRSTAGSS